MIKKLCSFLAFGAIALACILNITETNAYAVNNNYNNSPLSNAPVVNCNQYSIPSNTGSDSCYLYCRVDPQAVSTSLNVRDLPRGKKIGSLSPGEECLRICWSGDWWLVKYWYGAQGSGKAKMGWVDSGYMLD